MPGAANMSAFLAGLALAREFYRGAVQPILVRYFPRLPHSAALIGSGSEVLGYDDPMSTDHHWGPRVMLFLGPPDHKRYAKRISAILRQKLPYRFLGYSTHFSDPKVGEGDSGTQILQNITTGEVNHRVEILTIDGYMRSTLGIESRQQMSAADWLSIPQQKLLAFTSGQLFHDELDLAAVRERLRYYPRDIWLYMLACAWSRIGQDEHLAPRAGIVGDELGSALIAARLVRSIMQLCFLMERRYAPYPKWFGSAFAELACAESLSPELTAILQAKDYRSREKHLRDAYEQLNQQFNSLHLSAAIQPATQPFHGRGFMVSNAWRYGEALTALVEDEAVRAIAATSTIGSIDQFSDSSDMREAADLRTGIARLYLD